MKKVKGDGMMKILAIYTLIIQIFILFEVSSDKRGNAKTKITIAIIMFPIFVFMVAVFRYI
jgi:hypothetical protein